MIRNLHVPTLAAVWAMCGMVVFSHGAHAEGVPTDIITQVRTNTADKIAGLTKDERTAVRAFYARDDAKPIWTDTDGLTEKAKAVVRLIADADAWGLVAADYDVPTDIASATGANLDAEHLASDEQKLTVAALQYARHAHGGRIRPQSISSRFDQSPPKTDAAAILQALAMRDDAAHYLEAKHPRHPQFRKLKDQLTALRAPAAEEPELTAAQKTKLPDGPTLRLGSTHPHVALLRTRLDIAENATDASDQSEVRAKAETEEVGDAASTADADTNPETYDDAVKKAVMAFQSRRGLTADGLVGRGTRRALNTEFENPDKKRKRTEQLLLINMERWRWLPEDMGSFHVWNNVPEFQTRVLSDNKREFKERIIVGQTDKTTPSFSADMKYVIFHPSWGVPNGIKQREILPYLKQQTGFFGMGGTDTRVLKRHNLTVTRNGRRVDARKIDWTKTDIRSYQFTQPPGSSNVLGKVKFRFPNHHDVYMHDTPQRHLFKQSVRAQSHGCIRVRNPKRLAEVLLAHDKGWSREKVDALWRGRGNGHVTLNTVIPVHTTYMTAIVDDDGTLRTFKDLYGYDSKTARAIGLKPAVFERQPVTRAVAARPRPRKKQRPKARKKTYQPPETFAEALGGLFAN